MFLPDERRSIMSMLMTASLILGTCTTALPEAQFGPQLRAAMSELSAPVAALEDITTEGRINAFDDESKSLTLIDENAETHAFTWDDNTVWMLNGEKSTRKEVLIAGRDAQVKHNSDGLAAIVSVTTK
jgi:hypothetical protein